MRSTPFTPHSPPDTHTYTYIEKHTHSSILTLRCASVLKKATNHEQKLKYTDTDTQTHRHTDTQTHRHTDTLAEKSHASSAETHTHRHTHRLIHTDTHIDSHSAAS